MKEYNKIIDTVIKEFVSDIVKEHLPEIKFIPERNKMISAIQPKLDDIYLEYRFNKFDIIIERIYQLSGIDKNIIIKDYTDMKNDHDVFNFKIRNEIILYLKNKEN